VAAPLAPVGNWPWNTGERDFVQSVKAMRKRRRELLSIGLDEDPALLVEWHDLIRSLDKALQTAVKEAEAAEATDEEARQQTDDARRARVVATAESSVRATVGCLQLRCSWLFAVGRVFVLAVLRLSSLTVNSDRDWVSHTLFQIGWGCVVCIVCAGGGGGDNAFF
jgi:hypothetical protein